MLKKDFHQVFQTALKSVSHTPHAFDQTELNSKSNHSKCLTHIVIHFINVKEFQPNLHIIIPDTWHRQIVLDFFFFKQVKAIVWADQMHKEQRMLSSVPLALTDLNHLNPKSIPHPLPQPHQHIFVALLVFLTPPWFTVILLPWKQTKLLSSTLGFAFIIQNGYPQHTPTKQAVWVCACTWEPA